MGFAKGTYGISGPCLDCSDRFAGCHSNCLKYANYKSLLRQSFSNAIERDKTDKYIIQSCIKTKDAVYKARGLNKVADCRTGK